jgi:hypothetical protein
MLETVLRERGNQMDERTLTALKASIKHWEQNLVELDANKMTDMYCALCDMFVLSGEDCNGCPVMEETGEDNCGNTPWADALLATRDYQKHNGTYTRAFHAVKAEVDFLKGLLPTTEMP